MKKTISITALLILTFNALFAQTPDLKNALILTSGKHEISLTEFKEKEFCVYEDATKFMFTGAKIKFHLKNQADGKEKIKAGKTYYRGSIVNLKRHDLKYYFYPAFDSMGNQIVDENYEKFTKENDLGDVIESLKSGDVVEFYEIKMLNMKSGKTVIGEKAVYTIK